MFSCMIDLKGILLSMVMPEEVQEPKTWCEEGDNSHHTSDAGDQAPEECSCLCLKMIVATITIILNMIVICISVCH